MKPPRFAPIAMLLLAACDGESIVHTSDDTEPGCVDKYLCKLSEQAGQSLFVAAGNDDILEVSHVVSETSDHLVEVSSDATCHYLLRVDVVPTP